MRLAYKSSGKRIPERILDLEWWAVDIKKRRTARPVLAVYQRLLIEQRRAVLKALPAAIRAASKLRLLPYSTTKSSADIVGEVFDLDKWNDLLEQRLKKPLWAQLRSGWEAAWSRIGSSDPGFTARLPAFEKTMRNLLAKGKSVNATTADQLVRVVTDQMAAGVDIPKILDAATNVFDVAYQGRARTAANTLAAGGFESGQQETFKEAGIEQKMWLSSRDAAVRTGEFDHIAADGQVVAVDEPYIVSGEELMYPVDGAGSPGNIINCRCTSMPITR